MYALVIYSIDHDAQKVRINLDHNSAYTFNDVDYMVYHKSVNEGAKLDIMKKSWVDGLPVIEKQ